LGSLLVGLFATGLLSLPLWVKLFGPAVARFRERRKAIRSNGPLPTTSEPGPTGPPDSTNISRFHSAQH
jgi:hypothetical protein